MHIRDESGPLTLSEDEGERLPGMLSKLLARPGRLSAATVGMWLVGIPGLVPAKAEGHPVYKGAERLDRGSKGRREVVVQSDLVRRRHESRHPHRLVTGGPGYVGSNWGLGKPSFWGLGTRPDAGSLED